MHGTDAPEVFDYIVVGGGTAGCVLGARLTQDPGARVLLMEAGAADPVPQVLDGSSGINAMMHVRGDRSSYDVWEAAGAAGWNYDALLPFFKRSELSLW